jgi:hypothetical protein
MIYTLPYILLVCFYGALALWYHSVEDEITRKRIVIACVGVWVFFFGFRGFCFYDWMSYYPYFIKYNLRDIFTLGFSALHFEPGFMVLMLGCKSVFNNYHFFVLVCSLIDTVLLMMFLRRYVKNIPLALMICFCMNGLVLFTDLIRNSISILLFVNSLQFIRDRKLIPYVLMCLLGASFHSTALFYLPLYFFLHRKINKWVFLGIFLAGNLVYLLQLHVFINLVELIAGLIDRSLKAKIDEYMTFMPGVGFKISIGYLERLFTGVLIFCYINKLREIRKDNDLFINSMLLYFVVFFFFSEFRVVSIRFSYLFCFAYWTLWVDLIKCFSINNNRRLFIVFLAIYCIFKMYGSTDNIICRYENVLFGAQPYQVRECILRAHVNEVK